MKQTNRVIGNRDRIAVAVIDIPDIGVLFGGAKQTFIAIDEFKTLPNILDAGITVVGVVQCNLYHCVEIEACLGDGFNGSAASGKTYDDQYGQYKCI